MTCTLLLLLQYIEEITLDTFLADSGNFIFVAGYFCLAEKFTGEPVMLMSLLSGRLTRTLAEFVEECGVAHLVSEDMTAEIRDKYNVRGVPTTVIIDDAGRLMFQHVGFEDGLEEQFAKEIETLLAWRTEA